MGTDTPPHPALGGRKGPRSLRTLSGRLSAARRGLKVQMGQEAPNLPGVVLAVCNLACRSGHPIARTAPTISSEILSIDFPGQYQNISFAIFRMSEYQTIISSPMIHLSGFNRSLGAVFFANSTPWIAGGSSKWVFILFNPSSGSESLSFPAGAYLTFRS